MPFLPWESSAPDLAITLQTNFLSFYFPSPIFSQSSSKEQTHNTISPSSGPEQDVQPQPAPNALEPPGKKGSSEVIQKIEISEEVDFFGVFRQVWKARTTFFFYLHLQHVNAILKICSVFKNTLEICMFFFSLRNSNHQLSNFQQWKPLFNPGSLH